MAMKTIYNKTSGEARTVDSVDAREILGKEDSQWSSMNPNASAEEQNVAPQNVASVENEFRREPVGDDPPTKEREIPIIRNPVTDRPLMAPRVTEQQKADQARSRQTAAEDARNRPQVQRPQVRPTGQPAPQPPKPENK